MNNLLTNLPSPPRLPQHLAFTALSLLTLLAMFALLRLALLAYNFELAADTPAAVLAEAFFNGLRFDLRVAIILCLPLLLALASHRAMAARAPLRLWLTASGGVALFLGLVELDFFREFHQRLNGLVFQYLAEDPATVLSMLWHGFPVARYLIAWALGTWLLSRALHGADRLTRHHGDRAPGRPAAPSPQPLRHHLTRAAVLLLSLVVATAGARGTLRQGPPLRWGDAYTTDSIFANQLGLNGVLTLFAAATERYSDRRAAIWKATLPTDTAQHLTRQMLLTSADTLVDRDTAAARRDYTPAPSGVLPVRNVVVILMESFAGRYVGALGGVPGITPHFDRLAEQGLLFSRYFSNGTHTHQGMFASMACFPNLPGFEYLMQMPEGSHRFSGLPQLLGTRGFNDLYVYNGDFAWDNQSGFFGNQGMTRFIGRNDYVAPVFSDPTWGVSDQDMFTRATAELAQLDPTRPFYALLQTLSNHTPYALPDNLPVEPVTGHGALDQHLTAMRYSDWALGQFFEQIRTARYYNDTLFVIVGDHGFGSPTQLTEMDLFRFHVPLLMIAPGLRERFGSRREVVGTQTDIVPTVMGRLGGGVRHQCWGRDLLNLPPDDHGFGVIKPSGGNQTVALLDGQRILVQPRGMEASLYNYHLGPNPTSERLHDPDTQHALQQKLNAFIQTATRSLMDNTAGASAGKAE